MDISTIISDHLIQALGWTIVHSIWQAALIGLALFLVLPLIQNREAQTRYHVAFGALLLIFTTSLSTFLYYLQTGAGIIAPSNEIFNDTIGQTYVSSFGQSYTWSAFIQNNLHIISSLWIIGMILYSVKFGVGFYKIRRFKNQVVSSDDQRIYLLFDKLITRFNIKRKVSLKLTKNFTGPFVSGWLTPIIYFPFNLSCQLTKEELEDILAHEISHIVRNDFLMNLVQIFIENLFYYHPAIWWIGATIRKERELACDEMALQRSKISRIRYAGSLLTLGQYTARKTPILGLSAKGYKNDLLNRIANLLGEKQRNNQVREKIIISTTIICIMAIILSFRGPVEQHIFSEGIEIIEVMQVNDTLPDQQNVKEQVQLIEMKDGEITRFEIDGNEIPADQYEEYVPVIEELVNEEKSDTYNEIKTYVITNNLHEQHRLLDSQLTNQLRWLNTIEVSINEDDIPLNQLNKIYYFKSETLDQALGILKRDTKDLQEIYEKINDDQFVFQTEKLNEISANAANQYRIVIDQINDHDNESFVFEWAPNLDEEEIITEKQLLEQHKNMLFKIKDMESNQIFFNDGGSYQFRVNPASDSPGYFFKGDTYFSKNKNFEDFIFQEMKKDGLIQDGSNTLIITGKSMKVNGKKLNDSIYKKYKKMYENRLGSEMDRNTKIRITKDLNNSNTHILQTK